MNIKDRHFLIVGAGLSGVCVALQLLRSGAKTTLIDNEINYSSAIAAGMINPLVFRRMTKSWRVDEFLPYLKTFYSELEQETAASFFHPIAMRRLFSSFQERDFWLEKQHQDGFTNYMHEVTLEDTSYSGANNEFGSARLKETYYVDVETFLSSMKNRISTKGELIQTQFDYTALNGTTYMGANYTDVVFCEGYTIKDNPWFNHLLIDPTKGQTLTIKAQTLPENISLNRKCFVLPLGEQTFKIGATYEWHNPTINITEEAKEELLANLRYITDENIVVLQQTAGVRPTTRDRRPTIGTHAHLPNYHVFNGLGAKGYMLAPLLSAEFIRFLDGKHTLDKEVCINRFFKGE